MNAPQTPWYVDHYDDCVAAVHAFLSHLMPQRLSVSALPSQSDEHKYFVRFADELHSEQHAHCGNCAVIQAICGDQATPAATERFKSGIRCDYVMHQVAKDKGLEPVWIEILPDPLALDETTAWGVWYQHRPMGAYRAHCGHCAAIQAIDDYDQVLLGTCRELMADRFPRPDAASSMPNPPPPKSETEQ